ncbi:MAG: lysophospholipid acyltransferase family protein, partial [Pseudomonadota bacterium]
MAGPTQFTYSHPEDPAFKRATIRAIELVTGQPKLERLYLENQRRPRAGESFWQACIRRLEIEVDHERTKLEGLPASGPVVVVANHPFGVLDGLVIGYLVSQIRSDFKIVTNSLLFRAPELRRYLLPIDFTETREALETNLRSRAAASTWLDAGGVVVVFPGGNVSTAAGPLARTAVDPAWKPFTAKLIQRSRAPVLPVYFEGQNSRLFQVASHISQTLRYALLMNEVSNKIGDRIRVRIGQILSYADLAHLR